MIMSYFMQIFTHILQNVLLYIISHLAGNGSFRERKGQRVLSFMLKEIIEISYIPDFGNCLIQGFKRYGQK